MLKIATMINDFDDDLFAKQMVHNLGFLNVKITEKNNYSTRT